MSNNKKKAINNNLEFSKRNNLEKLFELQKDIDSFIREQKPDWRTNVKNFFSSFREIIFSFFVVITAIIPLAFKSDYFSDLKFQKQVLTA